ncbi:hypothetical protein [Nocardia huaxiensis]|uniref:hypothetical protein n=1 Tax=Nocardia huaxiensis TaxID=2755382 RepID=UPI001C67D97E|nr:hypothetical protein [Nocardia huaxiensis]UFS99223.1 hypothetical protein LPY97_15685 [Nocardia huaxiensis]
MQHLTVQAGYRELVPISFDTTGFQTESDNTWVDPDTGDLAVLQYYELAPDLPAPLEDLDTLRRRLTEFHSASGSLIEASVIAVV